MFRWQPCISLFVESCNAFLMIIMLTCLCLSIPGQPSPPPSLCLKGQIYDTRSNICNLIYSKLIIPQIISLCFGCVVINLYIYIFFCLNSIILSQLKCFYSFICNLTVAIHNHQSFILTEFLIDKMNICLSSFLVRHKQKEI